MFSTPLICCSSGVTTVDATTSALAPGYCPVTLISGGAISGYWAIGSRENDTAPRITKTIEITAAKIGRSMKKCERRMPDSIRLRLRGAFVGFLADVLRGGRRGRRRALLLRRDLHAGARAHQAVDDHPVRSRQAFVDDTQAVLKLGGNHVLEPRDAAIVDDQNVFARLLGTDRRVGYEQRRMRRRSRNADTAKHPRREQPVGIGQHRTAADRARRAVD